MKLVYTFGLILFLCRCNKEPVFEMPGPIDLYSWNLNKDTFWNATVILGGENISAKCVSNFEVNGIDTSTSFRLDFSKNNLKLQRLVLKIRNNLVSGVNVYSKNSLENIYLESENAIYGSNDIIVDSLKFSFNRKKDPKDDLNVGGLFLRLKTNSISQKNITLEMGASLLNFKGT
jgi:hypothetical protein